MDFRKVAGDIVGGISDEKWQKTESKIIDALDSAYRLGFLDGEAKGKGCGCCGCDPLSDVPAVEGCAV